MSNRDSN